MQLDDTGVVASLAIDINLRDVPQYLDYIRNRMFDDIPERGAGMNSTRIAEVLNYRKALPPIVTIAHVHALSVSSTRVEKDIAELTHAGVLRRVIIPNCGVGASDVGDGIASVLEWQRAVRANAALDADLKGRLTLFPYLRPAIDTIPAKYIAVMDKYPTSASIPGTLFTPSEASALTTSGFLTTSHALTSRSSLFASPGIGALSSLSSAGSRHAAGSLAAVGGQSASQHIAGGGVGRLPIPSATYNFSLPNTGSHIKLLVEARTHLLNLLKKSRYREAPMDLLRERWDGGVIGKDEQSEQKRARGEFAGLLPGRTKKWKGFWGLRFEWVLEECVGAGLVEIFETGSVGIGVRVV